MTTSSFSTFVAAGVAAALVSTSALAGGFKSAPAPIIQSEPIFSGEASIGYDSKYIFRGVRIFGDSAAADNLLWGDLNASFYGFNVGAWYAYSFDGDDYDELNLYGSYTLPVGDFDLTAGVTYYLFPYFSGGDDDTFEVYGSVAYNGFGFVTPSLTFAYDLDLFEGGYLEFKLESSIPLVADVLSLDPYALISYDFEYNSADSDFNHFQAGLALSYALTPSLGLSVYGAVAVPLEAIDDTEDTEFWGGASITYSF